MSTPNTTRPFSRTFAQRFKPRPPAPYIGIATICGRPAWEVVAERKAAKEAAEQQDLGT